jgi:hypothetical protein
MEIKNKARDFVIFLGWVIGCVLVSAFVGFVLKIFYNAFVFGWDLI